MSRDGRAAQGVLLAAAVAVTALIIALALGRDGGGSDASAAPRGADPVAHAAERRFGGSALGKLGAVVRWTRYGVPHIDAPGYESAAYAMGYLLAQQNICTIADSIVTVSAERSRWFGPDASWTFSGNSTVNNNLDSDFFYGAINARRTVEKLVAQKPPLGPLPAVKTSVQGAAEGYNAYLRDVGGAKGIPDRRCRGKGWVRPIRAIDLFRRFNQLLSLASSGVAIDGIARAQPSGGLSLTAARRRSLALELGRRMRVLGGLGSNAIALGGDATDNGRGMLLGNPHFPWAGAERLNQVQIHIPGKVDVSGATLLGVPLVLIGHTRGLAWSHTVATAWRFTPFELKLVPGDPHSYLLDGRPTKMKATRVTVKARRSDGSLGDRSTTLYETVHGPMFTSLLGLPLFPWTPAVGYAFGDVNANNFRALNHFFETNRAQSVRQYDAIERRYQGIPWVNSLAADRTGEAYYTMNGAVPNVPDSKAQACPTTLGTATFPLLGLPALDGSRSACEWGSAPGAAAPGILPSSEIPTLFRRDYVHNGNDSHWLTNPKHPLEGYERIVGIERAERTPRTRLGLIMIADRLAGRDGLSGRRFTLAQLQRVALGNRQYLGELWRDQLVQICRDNPTIDGVDVSQACDVLARWNVHDDLDSRGAVLFRRFASRAYPSTQSLPNGTQGSTELGARAFSQPFDPNDPVNTPRGLQNSPEVRSALAGAVQDLRGAGIPLDAPLRGYQFDQVAGRRTPIHGGPGGLGVFNAISAPWNGHGFDTVIHGSSFIMAAQFTSRGCPVRARTFVTYGQSEDPGSPHRTDYTRAFSAKRWNAVPYCRDDILSQRSLQVSYLGNACTPRGGLRSVGVRAAAAGAARLVIRRRRKAKVRVDVLRVGKGKRSLRPRRVRRFRRSRSFTVRRLRPGTYVARFRMRAANGKVDERRVGFRIAGGRAHRLRRHWRTPSCGMVRELGLSSPVFGGRRRPLGIRYRLDRAARVTIAIKRGRRTVRRLRTRRVRGERTYRARVSARRLRRGRYRVVIVVRSVGGRRARAALSASRL